MRAVVMTGQRPSSLSVQQRPAPTPGAGELRIDVAAAGVCFADLMATLGLYADAPKPPCVVGYEVAGTVAGLGDGVEEFAVGDLVVAGTQFGGYAEQAVAAADSTIPIPSGLSFAEAAAIPVNYSTAYAALIRYGALRPGERVLIQAPPAASGSRRRRSPRLMERGLGHRVALQARCDPLLRRRPRARLHALGMGT